MAVSILQIPYNRILAEWISIERGASRDHMGLTLHADRTDI